jgi:hypothetical protein
VEDGADEDDAAVDDAAEDGAAEDGVEDDGVEDDGSDDDDIDGCCSGVDVDDGGEHGGGLSKKNNSDIFVRGVCVCI